MRTLIVALVLATQFATVTIAAQPNMAQRKAKVVERAKQKKIMREREKLAKQAYVWLRKNHRWRHEDALVFANAIIEGVPWDTIVEVAMMRARTGLPWDEAKLAVDLRRKDPFRAAEYTQQLSQTNALWQQARCLRDIDQTLRLMGEVFERELDGINDNLRGIKDRIPPPVGIPPLPTIGNNAPM